MATINATLEWSDRIGQRDRAAWLLLIKGERIVAFTGHNIDGVAVVRGTDYEKGGKWSNTTYRLELAPGVRAIPGHDGWETRKFLEGLASAVSSGRPIDTWSDVANALGVGVPAAMQFLRSWRPKAAAALDEVDEALNALDEAADAAGAVADVETVVISFGAPTRRMREEGFWTNPKPIPGHNGEVRLIDKSGRWVKNNVTVEGILGTVVAVTKEGGHGGGYVSVTVAIVPGTENIEASASTVAPLSAPAPARPQSEPASPASMADLLAKFGRS